MVASIPNDIFQYSTISALTSGLSTGGPPSAFLTRHGTHGIGTFAPGHGGLALHDSVAYQVLPDGRVRKAPADANLPHVMVTIFEPERRAVVRESLSMEQLEGVLASAGADAGGRNSYMPFSVAGRFERVQVGVVAGHKGDEDAMQRERTLSDVKGTVFGFASPGWAAGVSVAGVYSYFLSEPGPDGSRSGGHVLVFESKGPVTVEWAVCGRFHLGLPHGQEWEALEMGQDAAGSRRSRGARDGADEL